MSRRHFDYRTALRAKGIKPIPPPDKLRTRKQRGDVELPGTGKAHVHRGETK